MNYSIKCGNCKGSHKTVSEVQACYGGGLKVKTVATPVEPIAIEEAGITEKQEVFLNKLLDERPALRTVENLWPDVIAKMTKAAASKWIETALDAPKEVASAPKTGGKLNSILQEVINGYYALPSKTGNNDLDFIRIAENQGKVNPANKGKRRVQRFIGGTGPIQISFPEQVTFAEAIAKLTPEEQAFSRALFGREVGQCGCCGKPLTDQVSRANGIGPDCAKKGW